MSDTARLPSEGEVLGDFELEEILSEVEYGTVFAASRTSDALGVAVTVVAPELTSTVPELASKFLATVGAVAGLDHPHLVPIHATGQTERGLPWLASDLIAGKALTTLLEEESSLPETRVLHIAQQLLSALEALHARGVVHCGLTTGSVIVTETADGSDHVKILCLGTKAHLRAAAGKAADGTLALDVNDARYAAPEQLRGEPTVAATDLYSLTLVLIEMLSGQPAMQGSTLEAVRMRQIAGKPKLPPALSKSPLVAAMARGLAKDPAKRFTDAAEFRAQLETVRDKVSAAPAATPSSPTSKPEAPAGSSINALRERLMAARQKIDAPVSSSSPAAGSTAPTLKAAAVKGPDTDKEGPTDAPTVLMPLDKLKSASVDKPARPQPGSELDLPSSDTTVKMPEDALEGALAAAVELKRAKAGDKGAADALGRLGNLGKPTVELDAAPTSDAAPGPAADDDGGAEAVVTSGSSDVLSMDSGIVELSADDSALLDIGDVEAAAAVPAPPRLDAASERPSVIDVDATQPVAADMLAALPAPGRALPTSDDDDDEHETATPDNVSGTMLGMAPLTRDPRATGSDDDDEDSSDRLLAPPPSVRPLWIPIAVGLAGVGLAILVGVLIFGGDEDEAASATAAETDEPEEVASEVAGPDETDETAETSEGATAEAGAPGQNGWGEFEEEGADSELPAAAGGLAATDPAGTEALGGSGEAIGDGSDPALAGVDGAVLDTAAVEAPTAVVWTLASTPEGAVVTDGADAAHVLCDATPCEVELEVSETPMTVAFALDGHEAHTETLLPTADGNVSVELVAMAVAEPEPAPKPKRKKKKKKKKKKTDPFGSTIYTD